MPLIQEYYFLPAEKWQIDKKITVLCLA
jgi:hypothetical protein